MVAADAACRRARRQRAISGLFTTQLSGYGSAVLLAHGGLIELPVGGPNPVFVDPDAFVGTSGASRWN